MQKVVEIPLDSDAPIIEVAQDLDPPVIADPLFLSLTHEFERCESANGYWACSDCRQLSACISLYDEICDLSAKEQLDFDITVKFIGKFESILTI